MNSARRNPRQLKVVFHTALLACLWLSGPPLIAAALTNVAAPTVGIEGRIDLLLPGTALDAKPVDPKSRLILRVAGTRAHGNLIDYDLRYVGLVPGHYDLREYLVRKDGTALTDLPEIPVEISALLPEKHQGELVQQAVGRLPFLGGYKMTLLVVGVLWAVVFVLLWTVGKKRRPTAPAPVRVEPPTLAERLQPLVQRAAQGKLSRDELAQLERLLLSHWRERLGLQETGMVEALQQLRTHPEGGALLRQLEDWLHRPPGSVEVDVEKLLAPYRQASHPVIESAAPVGGIR
jgi:hypothetical protein